jgi:hypothetical protein
MRNPRPPLPAPSWPTEAQLVLDPERGVLILLDAALLLAVRLLVCFHPGPQDPECARSPSHRVAVQLLIDAHTFRATLADYLAALDADIPEVADDIPF